MYKKIWDKVLSNEEKVEFEFSISDRYCKFNFWFYSLINLFFILAIFSLLLTQSKATAFMFFVFFEAALWFKFLFYLKASNAYAFTNKRVLIHRGWLNTGVISIDYDKITDIMVIEPFIERILFKTGALKVNTAGTGSHEVVLWYISEPYEIKKKLDLIRSTK